jgi:hypothetical protein
VPEVNAPLQSAFGVLRFDILLFEFGCGYAALGYIMLDAGWALPAETKLL